MTRKYGFIGWREFLSTRKGILSEFDRAKAMNVSRPVQVEHGNAGEAGFRAWLVDFLPEKYAVTSGYVIPDLLQANSEKIRHFDVIVYDRINAPKLWIDGNRDKSEQGKNKAIPAKHIYAIFECKASLSEKTCKESAAKLSELNDFIGHFSKEFFCGVVFFDVLSSTKSLVLKGLIPAKPIVGFWGGVVLRSDVSEEACGNITILTTPNDQSSNTDLLVPIVRPLSSLNIKRDGKGNVTIDEQGAGVMAFVGPDMNYHYVKLYGPIVYSGSYLLMLNWSHNGFATFALSVLNLLEGKPTAEAGNMFGQVFDEIL